MIPAALQERLEELGSLLVAYSGGVDSAYLAYAAHTQLGPRRTLAAIADSASLPRAELDDALLLAREHGFGVETVQTDELKRNEYVRNDSDRCFHCKEALFDRLFPLADERGLNHVALGTVTDDLGDVRPGLRSARERGAVAPLLDAGLSKHQVRELARESGLRVWDKPQAACLSSRIPQGTAVDQDTLAMIEAAEQSLKNIGYSVVRVRHHGRTARVEVGPDEVERLLEEEASVTNAVKAAGYNTVILDRRGYRRGGARLPMLES